MIRHPRVYSREYTQEGKENILIIFFFSLKNKRLRDKRYYEINRYQGIIANIKY